MKTLFDTEVFSDACISPCGHYRFWLTRAWSSAPKICWCMLNPSKADASIDDPTIRKCIGFSRRWGYGGIVVVNLFALRATFPADLKMHPSPVSPAGPDGEHPFYPNVNDAHIITRSDGLRLIAAWGVDGNMHGRERQVLDLLAGRVVECLGFTKDGHPKHPLYLPWDTTPVSFRVAAASPKGVV